MTFLAPKKPMSERRLCLYCIMIQNRKNFNGFLLVTYEYLFVAAVRAEGFWGKV
jgi:hypothetical protein